MITAEQLSARFEKAKRLIGYAPEWPLEKGFVEYIEWYKQLFERKGNLLAAS